VLATYADWQDASLWPTTQPVEAKMRRTASTQEDPLTKRGIIGAFCRAHSITDVLENSLSDRYPPTTQDDRYTFVGGSTTGGLVVYDDKYAFSHHATTRRAASCATLSTSCAGICSRRVRTRRAEHLLQTSLLPYAQCALMPPLMKPRASG
jgi:hypothetical protein